MRVEVEMEEGKESKKMDKYEIDSCVRTLIEAAEIKMDPTKMAEIKEHLAMKKKAIMSIQDVRDVKDKRDMSDEEGEY